MREAFEHSNVTPTTLAVIKDAIRTDVAVVLTIRGAQDRLTPIHSGNGNRVMTAAGTIFAGDLAALRAWMLLALLPDKSTMDVAVALRDIAG